MTESALVDEFRRRAATARKLADRANDAAAKALFNDFAEIWDRAAADILARAQLPKP